MAIHPIAFLYACIQWVLDFLFSPAPPPPHATLRRPKIAVIGAGMTNQAQTS